LVFFSPPPFLWVSFNAKEKFAIGMPPRVTFISIKFSTAQVGLASGNRNGECGCNQASGLVDG
jgi:hypothetical protein